MYYIFTASTNTESRIYRYQISHYNCIPRVLSLLTSNLSGSIPQRLLLLPFILSFTFIAYVPRTLSDVASRLSTIAFIARCISHCFHLCCSQSRSQVRLPSLISTYLGDSSYFLDFCFEKGEMRRQWYLSVMPYSGPYFDHYSLTSACTRTSLHHTVHVCPLCPGLRLTPI